MDHAIIPYSQRDSDWKDDQLGYSERWTIGTAGCAVTSVAMVLSQADSTMTPKKLNVALQDVGGFYGADIRWDKVPELYYPGAVRFVARRDWNRPLTDANLSELRSFITNYGPVVLEADFVPGTYQQEQHFVVALEMRDDDLRIIDPWDGAETWLMKRYAEDHQTLRHAVWGVRVYDLGSY